MTDISQLCEGTRCSLVDLPGAMDDRDGWRQKVKRLCANRILDAAAVDDDDDDENHGELEELSINLINDFFIQKEEF